MSVEKPLGDMLHKCGRPVEHEWTMDEIDAEIAAARKERRERGKAGA